VSGAANLPTFRCRSCHHGFESLTRNARCPRCGAFGAKRWKFPVLEEDGDGDGSCERPVGASGKSVTPVGGSLVAAVTKLHPR
jgi:rubredoxin